MIIDKQGRVSGRASLIDIALVLVIIGLIIGYGYRRMSRVATAIVNTDAKFYVTLDIEPLRQFSVDMIKVGDVFYKQHEQLPMGKVAAIRKENAKAVLNRPDGTSDYVDLKDRYVLYITLECTGNVNDSGYYINGSSQISTGSDVTVQSNMVICAGRVYSISDSLGG